VAIATALSKPVPKDMPDWEKKHLTGYSLHSPARPRVNLHVDALISPAVGRQDVYDAEPGARAWRCFYELSKTGRNVHQGTTFFVAKPLDDVLATLCQNNLTRVASLLTAVNSIPLSEEDARKRVIREVTERSGQGLFRQALLRESETCALTGTPVKEVLEAAHIMPYRGIRTNDPDNGLLLRADVHTLFDRGLLRVDPANGQIRIDPALKGSIYQCLDGNTVCNWQRLRRDALTWRWRHSDLMAWARPITNG
jgi:hypothetical protein